MMGIHTLICDVFAEIMHEMTVIMQQAGGHNGRAFAIAACKSGALKGVLAVNTLPLVSIDFMHNPASSVFDASLTRVIEGRQVKVLSWYDNEWGFSNRMLDTARAWAAAK